MGSPPMQIGTLTEEREVPPSIQQAEFDGTAQTRELKVWLRALRRAVNLKRLDDDALWLEQATADEIAGGALPTP